MLHWSSAFFWAIVTIVTIVPATSTISLSFIKQVLGIPATPPNRNSNDDIVVYPEWDRYQPARAKPHFQPAPEVKSSQLYIFGGGNDSHVFSSASRLDSTSGKWQSINSMPTSRQNFCGAVAGNKIYLFGGYSERETVWIPLDRVSIYDSSTDTYKIAQPMPQPRESCGAAALYGYVYVAGGTDGSAPTSDVFRYHIRTGQWSSVSSMKYPRSGLQLVELNNRLCAIGGESRKTVEVYNPNADQWSFVASTPTPKVHFGAAAYNEKIYAINSRGFEVYSRVLDQWSNLTLPNDQESFHTLVSMNDKLWTVGGEVKRREFTEDGQIQALYWSPSDSVYSYDPATQEWVKHPNMDIPREYHSAFVVNN